MRHLVTGGLGLIGSNLTRRLLSMDQTVVVVDDLSRGRTRNLSQSDFDKLQYFHKADLRSYEVCLDVTKGVDVVYHLADIVGGINYVMGNEYFVFHSNILINTNMLKAAIKNGVSKFIYVGTACSYPEHLQSSARTQPFVEEDAYPANPESSYGWSKLMGEYEVLLAEREGEIEAAVLRLHNVYGPPCEISEAKSQVIPALCRKVIEGGDLVVWGSGKQRRAFVYVDDIVDALVASVPAGIGKGVIQLGPGQSHSIAEIAEAIVSISGREINITFDTSRPEGDFDRFADSSKAQEVLGWKPSTGLTEGLARTYAWVEKELEANC